MNKQLLEQKFKLSSDYMLYTMKEDQETFFLINVKDGTHYQINSIAYDFLSLCGGDDQLCDLFKKMTSMYDVDERTLTVDFEELIIVWKNQKIIE